MHRQGEVADAGDAHIHRVEVGMIHAGRLDGEDHPVQFAPEADEARPAARGGPAQLLDEFGAAAHLADDGVRAGQRDGRRPAVRCTESDERAHPAVPAEPLDVVPRDEAAQTVADDVDLVVPGAGADLLDVPVEQLGRRADVAGQGRVVERRQMAPAVPCQGAAQQDEDGAVVDETVQEDDGRARVAGGGQRGRLRRPGDLVVTGAVLRV